MARLAQRRYPPEFDIMAAEMWVRNIVLKQPTSFLPIRTDDAFLVTLISVIPWLPSNWEANVVMCCAEDGKGWQCITLLRESIAWAKRHKCSEWRFRTETTYDIGPLARRVGGLPLPPCYAVRF
jgi:hypothetical protein